MKMSELIGRELEWAQPHALRKEYELRDGGMLHLSAGVTIHPLMKGMKELPWLALLAGI